jgi:hypothetical protein
MNFEICCDAIRSALHSECNDRSDSGSEDGTTPADRKIGGTTMPGEFRPPDDQQPRELTTDFLGEDRHEFVAKLAYKLWAPRGRLYSVFC